ncbi:MAG: hypothetical protein E7B49_00525, partial [Clostridium sp.]|nr:hypothetical protein [Clostridium sp.]
LIALIIFLTHLSRNIIININADANAAMNAINIVIVSYSPTLKTGPVFPLVLSTFILISSLVKETFGVILIGMK